ncbi:MAG: VanZ family protein [Candidatus Faecousia sp.]|uniref:VanZ family protein n=1 Tax=Faecousia sp. TaxID=2952921 RepID=UPI002A8FC220|nr:VanZ family protein [Candidatus Faecousia sp.]
MIFVNIYAARPWVVVILALAAVFIWGLLGRIVPRRVWKPVCGAAALLATVLVLWLTVWNRTPSEEHVFTWAAAYTNEFFREMFMNAVLYVPFGLAACGLNGPWGVLAGFLLSAGVEGWQYATGAGLAQGTDVLCNTLGAAVGMLPVWANRRLTRK